MRRRRAAAVWGMVLGWGLAGAEPPPEEEAWQARREAAPAEAEAWLDARPEGAATPAEWRAWASFLAERASAADGRGQFGRELDLAQRALALAERAEDPHLVARARNGIGLARWGLGEYAAAVEAFSTALEAFEGEGAWTWAAGAASNLGAVLHDSGALDLAVEYYQRALDLDRRGESPSTYIAETLGNLAIAWYDLGDWAKARALEAEALALREAAGDRRGIALSHHNLGDRALRAGRVAEAEEHLERAAALIATLDDIYLRAGSGMMLAAVRARTGRLAAARQLHTAALADFAAAGAAAEQASFEASFGQALAAVPGQEAWATEVLERSIQNLEAQGRRNRLDALLGVLVELQRRLGREEEAWATAERRESFREQWNEEQMQRRAQFLDVIFAVAEKDRELERLTLARVQAEAAAAEARALRNGVAGTAAVILVGLGMLGWRYVSVQRAHREVARANRELARANADKDTFIGIATHDLKTPLAAVRFGLGLLRERWGARLAEDADAATVLRDSERAAGRSVELVDAFLDAQLGREGGAKAWLRPAEVVDRVVADVAGLAAAKSVEVAVAVDEAMEIESDALRLERVLGNVVQNAVKFCRERGEVTVEAATDGDGWQVRVRDEGEGWGKAEATGAGRAAGHQLGLRYSRQLAATIGGVLATGDRPDRPGAEVSLRLACRWRRAGPGA